MPSSRTKSGAAYTYDDEPAPVRTRPAPRTRLTPTRPRAQTTGKITPPKGKPRGLEQERRLSKGAISSLRKSPTVSAWIERNRTELRIAVFTFFVIITLLPAVAWGYRIFAASRFFQLKKVEINGAMRTSREDMTRMLKQKVGEESLWQADLAALRTEVLRDPWIREAHVERVLPGTLRVTLTEREPYALMRRSGGQVVWVDRDGTMLGDENSLKNEFLSGPMPPIIGGLLEGDSLSTLDANRQRLNLYQRMMTDLDHAEPRMSGKIDEVNLDDPNDAQVRLVDKTVNIMLGEKDFRARLEKALRTLDAIERKDVAALRLLNVSDAERIVSDGRVRYIKAWQDDRIYVGLAE
ncbi:MAG: cell division protein FtsQ/DivIB [Blastocatellia bacterium]